MGHVGFVLRALFYFGYIFLNTETGPRFIRAVGWQARQAASIVVWLLLPLAVCTVSSTLFFLDVAILPASQIKKAWQADSLVAKDRLSDAGSLGFESHTGRVTGK